MAGKEMSLNFAGILGNLAAVCLAIDNYSEAETLYLNSLQLKRSLIGRYRVETLPTLDKLIKLYKAIGNDAATESFLQQEQEIRRIIQVARNLNVTAEQYRLKGNYAAAKPLYLRSLTAFRNVYGENHPQVATVNWEKGSGSRPV